MANTGIKLTEESKALLRRLGELGDREAFNRTFVKFFNREGGIVGPRIAKQLASGQVLRRRTGSLARSIMGVGVVFKGYPGIRVGSLQGPALKYVRVQEYGTTGAGGELPTITPKRARNLAIPLAPALTPSGVPKKPGPRAWGDLKFIPFKRRAAQNAQGALFSPVEFRKIQKAIRRGTFESLRAYKALYLLVRKVDLKPRRFLRDGFATYLPELREKLAAYIKAVFFAANVRGGKLS